MEKVKEEEIEKNLKLSKAKFKVFLLFDEIQNYIMIALSTRNRIEGKVVQPIDNLKLDLEEAQEVVGITGTSGNERAGSAIYAFSSVVENEVVQRERNMEQRTQAILKDIQKKERQLKRVENILSILTEYEL